MLLLLIQMDFFQAVHVFLQLTQIGLYGVNIHYLHFENDGFLQELFHQKLSQFSHGNNVLDAPASNMDGFLLRDTCVSFS
jgi:hypothetical protein